MRKNVLIGSIFLALLGCVSVNSGPALVAPMDTVGASWELFFPEDANKDGVLIYHTLTKPSAGLHILATASEGVEAGYSGGFAMNGSGTANAITGNRYENGNGHGTTGNRVGTGDGFGGHFGFSSEGVGGALYAIKQNSGYTGLSGQGPALSAENISDQGVAIQSTTSANNAEPVSNSFIRHNTHGGIISDQRIFSNETREAAFVGNRVALHPGDEWSGEQSVTGYQALISSNTSGSSSVTAGEFITDATNGVSNIGVHGVARGGNEVNLGGRFSASGGAVNVALRSDGDFWLIDGTLYAPDLPVHSGNEDAANSGLESGRVYRTSDGQLRVVVAR